MQPMPAVDNSSGKLRTATLRGSRRTASWHMSQYCSSFYVLVCLQVCRLLLYSVHLDDIFQLSRLIRAGDRGNTERKTLDLARLQPLHRLTYSCGMWQSEGIWNDEPRDSLINHFDRRGTRSRLHWVDRCYYNKMILHSDAAFHNAGRYHRLRSISTDWHERECVIEEASRQSEGERATCHSGSSPTSFNKALGPITLLGNGNGIIS